MTVRASSIVVSQGGNIERAGLANHLVGKIGLADGNGHPRPQRRHSCHRVDDTAVVFVAVAGRKDKQPIQQLEQLARSASILFV